MSHPEVILSLDQFEVLIGAASSCIRQMVLTIQAAKLSISNVLPIATGVLSGRALAAKP